MPEDGEVTGEVVAAGVGGDAGELVRLGVVLPEVADGPGGEDVASEDPPADRDAERERLREPRLVRLGQAGDRADRAGLDEPVDELPSWRLPGWATAPGNT